MSQKGQTHFKSRTGFAGRFCKCVWLFWEVMHNRAKVFKKKTLQISYKYNLKNMNK